MYYILNETNQVIAIDGNLLNLCGLSHIDELNVKVVLGDIRFVLTGDKLTLSIDNSDKQFNISKISLSSMLGKLTLINVIEEDGKASKSIDTNETLNILRQKHKEEVAAQKALDLSLDNKDADEDDLSSLLLDDDSLLEDSSEDEDVEESIDIDTLLAEAKEEESLELDETPKESEKEDDNSLELDLDLDDDISLDLETPKEETPKEKEETPLESELELDDDLDAILAQAKEEESLVVEDTPKEDDNSLELDLALEDDISLEVEKPKESAKEDDSSLELDLAIDDDLDAIFTEAKEKEEESLVVEESTTETPKEDEESLELDLTLDDDSPLVETETKAPEVVEESLPEDIDIKIDIDKTSSAIGVSIEDYETFLNEYIDNALDLEEDIKGDDEAKHTSAIATIAHLSEVLHIPHIGDILERIEPTPSDRQRANIDQFYDTLSRITTYQSTPDKPVESVVEEVVAPISEPISEPTLDIEDELLFDDNPTQKIESIEEPEIDTTPLADDMMDLFDTPKEERPKEVEEIAEPPKVEEEVMLDLFDTPKDEEKVVEPIEVEEASDDDILNLFDTPPPQKEIEEIPEPPKMDITTDGDVVNMSSIIEEEKVEEPIVETPVVEEPVVEAPIVEEVVAPEPEEEANPKGFGTIDLSDVKPIHFDFQLEEAANDLSLPVELIEEFVNDFIEQAREETEKMLKCYEEGDLDAIQKIGHLLKGTSSNLRIKPLADTLYKIQFCEDSNHLEHFIRDYWGHFLSFEIQINATTH